MNQEDMALNAAGALLMELTSGPLNSVSLHYYTGEAPSSPHFGVYLHRPNRGVQHGSGKTLAEAYEDAVASSTNYYPEQEAA